MAKETTSGIKGTNFEEFEIDLLKKESIRKAYEALRPKYDIIASLIERRNQLHISQAQLAKIIGTKQPAISRLEKGDYNTTLSTFFKVAKALQLDISLTAKPKNQRRTKVPA
jgi:DNA-binding XRE family transcriptional regulator